MLAALLLAGLVSGPQVSAQIVTQAPVRIAATARMPWFPYHLGLEKARRNKKHVFIQFFATWCGYCRKMDKEVFSDRRVRSAIAKYFIPIRITEASQNKVRYQGQWMSEQELLVRHQISGFPTLLYLNPEGKEIGKLPGYIDADDMYGMLMFVGTQSYLKMDYQNFKAKVLPKLSQH